MSRLLRDRYLVHDGRHGWDLATGALVPLDTPDQGSDSDQPPLPALVEALDHGCEGVPRWVTADVPSGCTPEAVLRRAAADGRARGYVSIDVEAYGRFQSILADELRTRALLLLARPGTPAETARAALVEASARSPRPHMLVTFRAPARSAPPLHAREARPVYAGRLSPPRLLPIAPDVGAHLARADRAAAFLRAGRHAAAERLLRDVAGALTRRDAHGASARVLQCLGRLLLARGRALDADAVFADAASLARRGQDEPLAIAARIWQAVARTDGSHLTAAESICRALGAGGDLPPPEQAWLAAVLARVLLWQGRAGEAAACDLADPAPGGTDAATGVWVGAMGVRLSLLRDDLFDAGQRARALVARAEQQDDPFVSAMALTAHLRVLTATGDLVLAGACLRAAVSKAREARAPLHAVRARLIWVDALRRAGRGRDADRTCACLARYRDAMPPLLRRALDDRLRGPAPGAAAVPLARIAGHSTVALAAERAMAATLIAIAQDEEQDADAVRQVIERAAPDLHSSRLDLCSADAGPVSVLMSVGHGLLTTLGARVLEAGIAIGPEAGAGSELGVPVRLGPRLVGALVGRWPLDRTPPPDSRALLDIVAAVIAPRVEGMVSAARERARAAVSIPELVGVSAAMADLRRAVARAAAAPFAVLIDGESGVGKELVARAIHHLSRRRERPFSDINCAAIPDDLLESELFGHARGAFTGAVAERAGLVEEADGGTLFLDEVADLSARAQAKLLRVLQQQEVRRVGETFSRKVDVRVVSAANRDLRAEAESGRFRQDLLYRLDVIRIRIPPLRERPDDVPVLARHFWQAAADRVGTRAVLTPGVMAALSRYHWPGNVRELQNVMAGLAVAAPARGRVTPALVPGVVTGAAAVTSPHLADARTQFERRFIEVALARAGGSRSRAARDMGLSRQGLLKMMARLGIEGRADV